MLIMWGVALIFVSYVAAQVASREIKVECRVFHDFPPVKNITPSFLADLKVKLVTEGERYKMNISWAINIDASLKCLTGTRIVITGESTYHCGYNPPLASVDNIGSQQIWFHYLVSTSYGSTTIQAANLPLPQMGSGISYKFVKIMVPRLTQKSVKPTTKTTTTTTIQGPVDFSVELREEDGNVNFTSIAAPIFGGLASLMILSSCCIIYKRCRANFTTSFDFKMLPTSPMVPVPVLVVYPAENLAFQQAVVALSEFLQWHGSCSVAVDMWQQGKIAELGPMRWLAEQAKAADHVLIVCPQPSSQPSNSPIHTEPSIPAATHDLYPLVLNMVASHAKSASDLAKFWVVQLGEQQSKRPRNLPLELRACKTFCLMKDLIKLCRSLHSQRHNGKKISDLIFRQGTEMSTVKLREAVEKLGRHQPSIFRGMEPLKSVVTAI